MRHWLAAWLTVLLFLAVGVAIFAFVIGAIEALIG